MGNKETKLKYENFIDDLKIGILMNFSDVTSEEIDDLLYDVAIEPKQSEVVEVWIKNSGIKLNYDKKDSQMTDDHLILYYNDYKVKKEDYKKLVNLNDKFGEPMFNISGYLGDDPLTIQFVLDFEYYFDFSDSKYKKRPKWNFEGEKTYLSEIKDYIRTELQEFFYNSYSPQERKQLKLSPGFIPMKNENYIKSYKEFLK